MDIKLDFNVRDSAIMAHVLKLYQNHGQEIAVESNYQCIFDAAGFPTTKTDFYHKGFTVPERFNLPTPDVMWSGSRIALNLIPQVGTENELWNELCDIRLDGYINELITESHRQEINKCLEHLPKPIILLQTSEKIDNAERGLPQEITFELCRYLLDKFEGSIISLDENPQLCPHHGRIRHWKRDFAETSLIHLAALMEQAVLLIAIEGSSYQFASLTHLPVLGIFNQMYPSCVTLPRPSTVNMTRGFESYKVCNIPRRKMWNIIEYMEESPSATEIALHALRMISPRRYCNNIGKDIVLQQLVGWCHGSLPMAGFSAMADRKKTFDYVLKEMRKRFLNPTMIETGCVRYWDIFRGLEGWAGAGNSTYLFGYFLQDLGKLITVDINPENIGLAKKYCKDWTHIEYVLSDSVQFLKNYQGKVDVVYLDSLDVGEPNCEEHCFEEFKAIEHKISPGGMVLIDDVSWDGEWVGKGAKILNCCKDRNFKITYSGYQVILERDQCR